jgi:nitric oxide reductase subunit B
MVVQEKIALFYWMREVAGLVFLIGLICYIASFFVGRREPERVVPGVDKATAEAAAAETNPASA